MNEKDRLLLEAIGWHPGRDIADLAEAWMAQLERQGGFTAFPAARRAIHEFGGLKSSITAPGERFAREPFDLTPVLAAFEDDRFDEAAEAIGQPMYPLGEGGGGHYFVGIAADGRVFHLAASLDLAGGDIVEAIVNMIEGRSGERLIGGHSANA
jgi:SUKH-3 immunity protein